MIFYFVRHGEILSNTKKIYAGWSEERLTPKGKTQAQRAAKKLAKNAIEVIYTSPLQRAVQTAEIIGSYLKRPLILEESFIEMQLGPWEGFREDEIALRYKSDWKLWNTRPKDLFLPGRETLSQLLQRVLNGIEKIKKTNSYHSVIIVTHTAIIRVLFLYINNMDFNKYRNINIPNGEIFVTENLQNYMTILAKRSH